MTVSARVLARRLELKLTQEKAAAKGDMSLRTYQRTEQGTHKPNLRTLEAIARALDCTVAELVDGERATA